MRGLALLVLATACASATGQGGEEAVVAQVTWMDRIQVDSGGGYQGPWRMNESEYDYVDDPSVAITDQGFVAVAWVDQAQKEVLFQIFGPDGTPRFDRPTHVSRSPRIFSWLPRVVFTDPDTRSVAVLWQEIVFSGGTHGGEIFFSRSTDGGRTFSEPLNLSNSMAGDGKGRFNRERWHNGSLDLAAGPQRQLYAAWTEYEGVLWFSRSADGGQTFSTPIRIADTGDAMPARGPALEVGPRGTLYLAWAVGDDPKGDLRVARSDDEGRSFTEPRVVETDGYSDAPKLAVDGSETLHLVFGESAPGPSGAPEVRYTRAAGMTLEFDEPRVISTLLGPGAFPDLALDAEGNLYVLWDLLPEVHARPLGLGFALSTDGGRSFSSPMVVPGSKAPDAGLNGSLQGLLMRRLAVSDDGTIAVANSTFLPGERSAIWLIRGQRRAR